MERRFMRRAVRVVLLSLFLIPTATPARAQSQTAEAFIHGTVVDVMRMGIPGAAVTATTRSGAVSATTDAAGRFTLVLSGGEYTVRVHMDGFRDAERRLA